MASLTNRNIDAAVKEQLRVRAASHGHSMEAEARRILQRALATEEAGSPLSCGTGVNDPPSAATDEAAAETAQNRQSAPDVRLFSGMTLPEP